MVYNITVNNKLTIIIKPSEIHGIWTAHCLEFDLVTQGDSYRHALEMIGEAIEIVELHDKENNVTRNKAPNESWTHIGPEVKVNMSKGQT